MTLAALQTNLDSLIWENSQLEIENKRLRESNPDQAALPGQNSGQLCLLPTTILSRGTVGQSRSTVRTTDESKLDG